MKTVSLFVSLLFTATCVSASEDKTRASHMSTAEFVWQLSTIAIASRQNHRPREHISNAEGSVTGDGICLGEHVIPWLDDGNGHTRVWRLSDTRVLICVTKIATPAEWHTKAIPIFAAGKEAEKYLEDESYGLERNGRKLNAEYAAIVEEAKPLTPEYEEKLLGEAQKKLELLGKKAPAAISPKPEES